MCPMTSNKLITLTIIFCASFVIPRSNAATIPAGTTLTINTVSPITSQSVVGRSFEAKLAQEVSVRGTVLLPAGIKVFGKIRSSRANPRKSEPLTLELTSISVSGRNVAVKTNSAEPGSSPRTPRQARYGHTAGTLRVDPGTKMQFQLTEAVSF